MQPASDFYTYDRRKSPILPLTPGRFRFLHHSNNRRDRVLDCDLDTFSLGSILLPSGKLLITDPFVNLSLKGQLHIQAPVGEFPVVQTLYRPQAVAGQVSGRNDVRSDMDDMGMGAPLVAYLSVIFDPAAMARRQAWQASQKAQNLDASLPRDTLVRLSLSADGRIEPDEAFDDADEFGGLIVRSGTTMLTDADQFQEGMPDEQRGTWYSTLFEHGNHESWFSYMDRTDHLREGAANFPLPLRPRSRLGTGNLILSQTGWGDGQFMLFAELDPLAPDILRPVAYHLDFEVVPHDPLLPPLKNAS